ncbi:NUDIX hydrolase [Haloarchaeobius litoreus]|uniref:NUDIX hydrolase n=1 Tax=Haloarchaeobius litoreus TaxID=755306 RepID=A0ABD6DF19_9EURY|nr:NUDIX domain-containing protein [Haloarchaeobius litoreus]
MDIDSIAVVPDHCHRCGSEVATTEWEGDEHPWCPDCDTVLSRHPVPGVHIVVYDEECVLMLDEPIPQHEGLLSLPGGFAKYDEGPKETGLRELEEETGLTADPDDLSYVTVVHAEFPKSSLYLLTYAVHRSNVAGELEGEAEGFEAAFHPVDEVLSSTDRVRDSDQERIELAIDGPGRAA